MKTSIESQLQTAYTLIKSGDPEQAAEILKPLVRANPKLADGWFLLGHALSQPQEKIRCFQRVLQLEPDHQAAQKQLARLRSARQTPAAFIWGLAGLAMLIVCLSGLGLLWGFRSSLVARLEPMLAGNQASNLQATLTLPAPTATPRRSATPKYSPTPQPTARPTITLPPTATPQPSVTILPTSTQTFTPTPTRNPQATEFKGCITPNGLPEPTGPFKIENFGKDQASVHLKGVSRNGNYTIICQAIVRQGRPVFFTLLWGSYEYTIFRAGAVRTGTFDFYQDSKLTMRIQKDKTLLGEYP